MLHWDKGDAYGSTFTEISADQKGSASFGDQKDVSAAPEVLLERARREAVKVRIPHLEDARIRTEVREIGGAKAMMTKGKDMPPYMLYLEDGHYRGSGRSICAMEAMKSSMLPAIRSCRH